jgi:hypothetical protein
MSSLSVDDLRLKPATLKQVERSAKRAGQTTVEYMRGLIERAVSAERSFDEILAPVRAGFSKAGVTPEELDELVSAAREDIYARSHRRPARGRRTGR